MGFLIILGWLVLVLITLAFTYFAVILSLVTMWMASVQARSDWLILGAIAIIDLLLWTSVFYFFPFRIVLGS